MPNSVYIHIPFCKRKCKYCSFVSYNIPELITGYMFSLMKEISDNYQLESLNTLYIGGGTPSLVQANLLEKVLNKFNFTPNAEITIEFNPDDSDIEYLKNLRKIGFNRISIGAQSFNDRILSLIGRRHNALQITKAIEEAQQSDFDNISIDLMYGLPTQTLDNFISDINKVLTFNIKHISTYGLKIEQESYFGKNPPLNIPSDDEQADMYETANKIFEENGFSRYEVSNFALKGYESKHNLNYWNNAEYYGFGVSAHGYTSGIRYYNTSSIEKYMKYPSQHEYGKFLTNQEKLEEEIFLGFRKTEGINIHNINEKFNIDFENKYKFILEKYNTYFVKTEFGYKLNTKGTMLSNIILSEFLD